jgi:hypothetical protein
MASLEVGSPNYTASLDAALALAERVLPGVMWWLSHQAVIDGVKYYHAEVSSETEIEGQSGYAATPALALCAAILRVQSEARPTGEDSPANEGEGAS